MNPREVLEKLSDIRKEYASLVEEAESVKTAQKVNYNFNTTNMTKGFCQVKQIPKAEKNSEVGGWVKPQLGFLFFWTNPSFSRIFGFFLT